MKGPVGPSEFWTRGGGLVDKECEGIRDIKSRAMSSRGDITMAENSAYIRDRVGHSSIKGEVPIAIWTGT